jgi:hypothetical protein
MEREPFAGAQILVKLWYKSENCLNAQSDHGFFEGNAVLAGFSFLLSCRHYSLPPRDGISNNSCYPEFSIRISEKGADD